MTPEDRDAIFSLVVVPGRGAAGSAEDVLRHFGTTDGVGLSLRLLSEAIAEKSPADLEAALILSGTFGTVPQQLPYLVALVPEDWHKQHENVVAMLSDLRAPEAVDALHHAAVWAPAYLDWNETRPLATKAIWALGAIPGPEAERALTGLADDPDEVVRDAARAQLDRRRR
jgi:HEAT repeat protein